MEWPRLGELTPALRDNELDVALVLTKGAVADIIEHDKNRVVRIYVDSPLDDMIPTRSGTTCKRSDSLIAVNELLQKRRILINNFFVNRFERLELARR